MTSLPGDKVFRTRRPLRLPEIVLYRYGAVQSGVNSRAATEIKRIEPEKLAQAPNLIAQWRRSCVDRNGKLRGRGNLDEHATRRIAKQPRQQHRCQNTGDEVVAGDRAGPTLSRSTKRCTRVPTEGVSPMVDPSIDQVHT